MLLSGKTLRLLLLDLSFTLAATSSGLSGLIKKVTFKTGDNWSHGGGGHDVGRHGGTDDAVRLKLCDNRSCCSTSSAGSQGLNNRGNDREPGHTDVYSGSRLGGCNGFSISGRLTATLELAGPDGWFVDWLQVQLDRGALTCPVYGWLDTPGCFQGACQPAGPRSRNIQCY